MLTVLLFFFLGELIIKLIDAPFKEKIVNSTSVEESLRIRRRLKVVRRIVSFFLIVLMLFAIVLIGIRLGNEDLGQDLGMVIAYAILVGWRELRGNVQDYSLSSYLSRYSKFALYLRAFEADYYTKNPREHSFESALCKLLKKKRVKVCAIGMTKEVDAPLGATRIYLADESWQQGVRKLIEQAGLVFVLVSDRDSCVWEIMQSTEYLPKFCFFVDDFEKYSHVIEKVGDRIPFPTQEEILKAVPTMALNQKKPDSAMSAILFDEGKTPTILEVDNRAVFLKKILSSERFIGKL